MWKCRGIEVSASCVWQEEADEEPRACMVAKACTANVRHLHSLWFTEKEPFAAAHPTLSPKYAGRLKLAHGTQADSTARLTVGRSARSPRKSVAIQRVLQVQLTQSAQIAQFLGQRKTSSCFPRSLSHYETKCHMVHLSHPLDLFALCGKHVACFQKSYLGTPAWAVPSLQKRVFRCQHWVANLVIPWLCLRCLFLTSPQDVERFMREEKRPGLCLHASPKICSCIPACRQLLLPQQHTHNMQASKQALWGGGGCSITSSPEKKHAHKSNLSGCEHAHSKT